MKSISIPFMLSKTFPSISRKTFMAEMEYHVLALLVQKEKIYITEPVDENIGINEVKPIPKSEGYGIIWI